MSMLATKKRLKSAHPLIAEATQNMLVDLYHNMVFYGHFSLFFNHISNKNIKSCSIYIDKSSIINFVYNPDFFDSLGESANGYENNELLKLKQVTFMYLHCMLHIIFNHANRIKNSTINKDISHLAQDMIINSILKSDIPNQFSKVPVYPKTEENDLMGLTKKNMAMFIPIEYEGEILFEDLYMFVLERYEYFREKTNYENQELKVIIEENGINGLAKYLEDKFEDLPASYGRYGKDSKDSPVDMFSLEFIFSFISAGIPLNMDTFIPHEVTQPNKDIIVNDIINNLKSRGYISGNIEETIQKLIKKRKDHLKFIKRNISNYIIGSNKTPSIARPNRRGISGAKGKRKVKSKVNVILDTSGSMSGIFSKILSYIFQTDIEVNIIQIDTEIQNIQTIKKKSELKKINIKGLGGTTLQPAVDVVVDDYNGFNTVILTDGYTDTLSLNKLRGRVLIITSGMECPISSYPKGGLKQYIITD